MYRQAQDSPAPFLQEAEDAITSPSIPADPLVSSAPTFHCVQGHCAIVHGPPQIQASDG